MKSKFLKKLSVFLRADWQSTLEYRGMMAIWMFQLLFQPLVILMVWINISQGNPTINLQEITNYYVLMPIITMLTGAWSGVFLAEKIKSGRLNLLLIKPVTHLLFEASNNLAEKIVKFTILVPGVIILIFVFPFSINPSIINVVSLIVATILALVLNFTLELIMGYVGFWFEDISGILNLKDIGEYTFGGLLVPVFLFPETIRQIAYLLPFRYTRAFAIEIISGALSTNQIIEGLTIQFAWVALACLTAQFLWKQGVRKYGAFGG